MRTTVAATPRPTAGRTLSPPSKVDCLEPLAACADAHAALVRNVRVPNAPSVSRQMPSGTPSPRSAHTLRFDRLGLRSDVERGELLPVGLGEDERRVVGTSL